MGLLVGKDTTVTLTKQTRAVRRNLRRGQMIWCEGCAQQIKGDFRIGKQHGNFYIIVNRYVRQKWKNVEYYHLECWQGEVIE